MHRRSIISLFASVFAGIVPFAGFASGGQSGGAGPAEASVDPVDLKLDEASAIRIVEVILVKVYGERVLRQRPWKAALENDETVYYFRGTLRTKKGGVAEIRLKRSNAEVISIRHGK